MLSGERNRRRPCRSSIIPRAITSSALLYMVAKVCLLLLCVRCTVMVMVANAFSTSALVMTDRFRFDLYSRNYEQCDFLCIPEASMLTEASKEKILKCMINAGMWDDTIDKSTQSSETLILLANDFVDRPEVFSSLLVSDFGFPVLVAHQTRALVMAVIQSRNAAKTNEGSSNTSGGVAQNLDVPSNSNHGEETASIENLSENASSAPSTEESQKSSEVISEIANNPINKTAELDGTSTQAKTYSNKELKSTIVNEQAKRRMQSVNDYNYGLPKDYATVYPKLASELDDYYVFMTQPSTYSQENPIRHATAKVYMNHAKLFLGWCCQNPKTENKNIPKKEMSIFQVVPNKEKESADNIIRFVLWLRTRDISVSYEANLLRGIIKLLKFRFAKESTSDPLDGKNTFDDIPIIKEVRKLHRDANQKQRLAPRSSDESKKWITWQDYLGVTQNTKNEVLELINSYEAIPSTKRRYAKGDTERLFCLDQVRVAEAYQRYLILAILASVPDRQRTVRELEVGRTLIKDNDSGCWVVKHGPGDYKTGKHYGERPAMQLAEELTPAIDDFIERWRPSLKPKTNALLVQSKTGKPMTANSVFKRVVRCCFKYTGKSVNPHLLRDIIVTHVRETDASEKELEALALYMGHSIQMQRTSYDRRTLSTKVAPAVKLMKAVNKID